MLKFLLVSALGTTAIAGDFFPLETGNSWTYRERRTGQSFTVQVGTPVMHDGAVYYSLRGYTERPVEVRLNYLNNLVYWNDDQGAELLLTSFEAFEGGWFFAPVRGCEQEGQTLVKRATHEGPAGPIHNVLQVRYRSYGCADTGVTAEQYAENLGMLERTVTTIAGPRTYELVRARVGAISVDALAHGRFTVTLDDPPQGDTMAVTLRLTTRPPAPLKLTFPSAQEFDVAVRDLNGRTLYQWSAAQVFAQVVHERWVAGEWAVEVRIPRPSETGAYTVEGWLTTAADGPRFAAAVPSTVAPAN
jgi:hypothetical protein